MSQKSKSTALILGVILVALFGVFWATSRPNVARGQDDLPPSPEPPDPTLLAEFAQMPDCCADEVVTTPGPDEVTLTVPPPEEVTTTPPSPTQQVERPMGKYMAPSDEWTTYQDLSYGYSFEYPVNFTILPSAPNSETHVTNRPLNDGQGYYDPFSEERFSVIIVVFQDIWF